MSETSNNLILCSLDDYKLGIPLDMVLQIIRAAALTTIPKVPETILGFLNYHGTIIPVYNLRKKLNLAARPLSHHDRFILIKTGKRQLCIWVDEVTGISENHDEPFVEPDAFQSSQELRGLLKTKSGLLMLLDPEKFLSPKEEVQLAETLSKKVVDKKQQSDPNA